jgi:hypothetical protein
MIAKRSERFEKDNMPTKGDIMTIAESCSEKLATSTYAYVVDPCRLQEDPVKIIDCIANYRGYYENVLKYTLSSTYDYLKEIEGEYVEYKGNEPTLREKLTFILAMTNAYSQALAVTIYFTNKNYDASRFYSDGLDQNTFLLLFQQYLYFYLTKAIIDLYNGNYLLNNVHSNDQRMQELINMHRGDILESDKLSNLDRELLTDFSIKKIIDYNIFGEISNRWFRRSTD